MAAVADLLAWRGELLEIATRLKRLEWPTLSGSFVYIGMNGHRADYGWTVTALGALEVRSKESGNLVVSSKSGSLFRLGAELAANMAAPCTEAESWRAELLKMAAERHLRAWPDSLRGLFLHQTPEGRHQLYAWTACSTGELVVFEKGSGTIKACSEPGEPFTLASDRASAAPMLHAGLRFTRASALAAAQAAHASGVEAGNKAHALLEQLHDDMAAEPASPYLARLGEVVELLLHEGEQSSSVLQILQAMVACDQCPRFVPLPCRPQVMRRRSGKCQTGITAGLG